METTSEIVIFANFMSSLRDTESLTHCTIMRLHYTSHSIDTCHSKLQAHVTHSSNLAKNLSTQLQLSMPFRSHDFKGQRH